MSADIIARARAAILCLSLACQRGDPTRQQLEARVDVANHRALRLLNNAATPPDSLDSALVQLRRAREARDKYLAGR